MKNKELQDYTPVFKRINVLTNNIRKLRKAFSFSQTDERAIKDKEFIERWRRIAEKNCDNKIKSSE